MSPRPILVALALGTLLGLLSAAAELRSARAVTGPDCRPQGQGIVVPDGLRAVRFRVLSLSAGRPCGGDPDAAVEGFSLRRGGGTVFVYYRDGRGRTVADPVPLRSLELPSGVYSLCAAPSAGAAVSLAWELETAP